MLLLLLSTFLELQPIVNKLIRWKMLEGRSGGAHKFAGGKTGQSCVGQTIKQLGK